MRCHKAGRKFILPALVFAAFLSCGGGKTGGRGAEAEKAGTSPTSKETPVEAALAAYPSEGIRLVFTGISPETARIFVNIIRPEEKAAGSRNIVSTYADIRGIALDNIKKGGALVCPFVEGGKEYLVTAYVENNSAENSSEWLNTECTPDTGVYPSGKIELILNETKTGVTLSPEPEFRSEVEFAPKKYHYAVTLETAENWGVDIADNGSAENTKWNFADILEEKTGGGNFLESGNYRAFVTAFCSLVHEGVTWQLELAKSEEFTFSF